MAPKKATSATATSKAKKTASGDHQSFKDMIKEAIITLKERSGSSRQAIKKYILSNKNVTDGPQFTHHLNKAIQTGVTNGDFTQPGGPSARVKLARKDDKKTAAPKEPAAKKEAKPKTETKKKTTTGTATTKKATTSKATTAKSTGTKKATTKKTTTAAAKPKAKANTSSKRKTSTSAPAVVDKPTTLTKTKSGRVAKTTTQPSVKKTPAKKAAPKKAAPKKSEAKAEA